MVKVGDKVRVTTTDYPFSCPKGTICKVIKPNGMGSIFAEACDRPARFCFQVHEYEPLVKEDEEEFSYNFAEEAAKHSIKITYTFPDGAVVTFDGRVTKK